MFLGLLVASSLFGQTPLKKPVRLVHEGAEIIFTAPLAHPRDLDFPQSKPVIEDGIAMLASFELEGGQMPLLEVGMMPVPDGATDTKAFCVWLSKKQKLKEGNPKIPGQFSIEEIQKDGSPFGALLVRTREMNFSGAPVPSLNLMFIKIQQGQVLLLNFIDLDEKDPMKLLPALKTISAGVIASLQFTSLKAQ
jgi:hypothetical protein